MALAAPPDRTSAAEDLDYAHSYNGYIKVRLGHSAIGSVIVPDQLVISQAGWRFYQPSFFGPCKITFNLEPSLHLASFSMDVGGPQASNLARVVVTLRSDEVVRRYEDGSQVFRCLVEGPRSIQKHAAGRCSETNEGEITLQLFHHTDPDAYRKIRESSELWSSPWNLAGVRKLKNIAYCYLTSLPKVRNEADLSRIAMASEGSIRFQTTSARAVEEVINLEVYRSNTRGRTASLKLEAPWELISPPHLLIHQPIDGEAYYEIQGPEIFRLGMMPGESLHIDRLRLTTAPEATKSFEYIILGDASSPDGIAAPYDEENTQMVMHCERLEGKSTLFDFWLANQNTDQTASRSFEEIRLE